MLLPLCSAIVHHGGIGTTAAALAAGCPQFILPLAWDQPDNAARVKRLGVGFALGPRERSSNHIARGLSQVMAPAVREQCRKVALVAADENGLNVAAEWVEQLARSASTRTALRGLSGPV
jgi:UDP:flavonoid glycosyltransferase YjiC (YdhE family)